MSFFINENTSISDSLLQVIAYLPTKSLNKIIDPVFYHRLRDEDFMRIAVFLAQKSYDEEGCPIGGLIIDKDTRQILGKGHNTLVQENNPYNHGETAAIRDAGRIDFSQTILFTTLSPCDVCATLIYLRQFHQVIVGNATSVSGNEGFLMQKGIEVTLLEDQLGILLYNKYRQEKPNQDLEDWKGLASVSK